MRLRFLAPLAIVGLGVLVHLGGGLSAAETKEVKIDNYSFAPGTVTVPVGTMVTWTNHDETVHTVVAADKSFKSGGLDTDDKFSFTFTKPGSYSYLCTVHPYMTGKIIVR